MRSKNRKSFKSTTCFHRCESAMAPRGHKHSLSAINNQLDNDATVTINTSEKPTKKGPEKLAVPLRNLPERSARTKAQTEITAPVPKRRRSGAQKEADDLAELANLEARIAELKQNHRKLAEMELEEEEEQAERLAARSEVLDPSDEEEAFFDINGMDADEGDETEAEEDSTRTKVCTISYQGQLSVAYQMPEKAGQG